MESWMPAVMKILAGLHRGLAWSGELRWECWRTQWGGIPRDWSWRWRVRAPGLFQTADSTSAMGWMRARKSISSMEEVSAAIQPP